MERTKHQLQHLRLEFCDSELCRAINNVGVSQMIQDPYGDGSVTQQDEDVYEYNLDQDEEPTIKVSMLTTGP